MMDDQTTATSEELDHQYDDIVEAHREYLNKLQAAFDKHCEEIGTEAKKKLEEIPEEDKEARKEVLIEEQRQLDESLAELKKVVNKSSANVREKLEAIENKREESALDLEAELAKLETEEVKT